MQKGQIFEANGRNYGFLGLSAKGCVQAYDLEREKGVQFTMKYSKTHLIPLLKSTKDYKISSSAVSFANKLESEEKRGLTLAFRMKDGEKFIGNDGEQYTFIRLLRTRFEFEKNGKVYTANPSFIKEIL
jgi:hypothetical protein